MIQRSGIILLAIFIFAGCNSKAGDGEDSGAAAVEADTDTDTDGPCVGERSVTHERELSVLAGCEIIEGDLTIHDSAMRNVEPLASLRLVMGALILEANE